MNTESEIKEKKQKEFFENIKSNLNDLNSDNDFKTNLKILFEMFYLVKERTKNYKDNKFEKSEIYIATEKLLESASNDFKNINKEKALYIRFMSQYYYFRKTLTEKENQQILGISKSEFNDYRDSLKKEVVKSKIIKDNYNQLSF